MTPAAPQIILHQAQAGLTIEQQRPAVAGILRDLPLGEALDSIPRLLPICGVAQGVAARRATAAAAGKTAAHSPDEEALLWREQALAAAWRLAIDWPDVLDVPREIAALKAVQQAPEAQELRTALLVLLPGLDCVTDLASLAGWIENSDCTAAAFIRQAQSVALRLDSVPSCQTATGDPLLELAEAALSAEPFDPLLPKGAGIEIGALAMARHPLISALTSDAEFEALSGRLSAQILDTLFIADQLINDSSPAGPSQWPQGNGIGLGRAMTARGPVFHRVCLDNDHQETVRDWRVLAPTDWHFCIGGALLNTANSSRLGPSALALLVAGFDPCAPWRIETAEPAHA